MSDKYKGVVVYPRPNEEPDKFIKRFLKKVRNDGILNEVWNRKGYDKPSVKRRRKAARARFLRRTDVQS